MSQEAGKAGQEFDLVKSLTEISWEIRTEIGSAVLASYIINSGPVSSSSEQKSREGSFLAFATYIDRGDNWERTTTFFPGNGWQIRFSDKRSDIPDSQKRDYSVSKTPHGEIVFDGNLPIGLTKKVLLEFYLTGVLDAKTESASIKAFLESSPEEDNSLVGCHLSSVEENSYIRIPLRKLS